MIYSLILLYLYDFQFWETRYQNAILCNLLKDPIINLYNYVSVTVNIANDRNKILWYIVQYV